jgi:hypothetical protein
MFVLLLTFTLYTNTGTANTISAEFDNKVSCEMAATHHELLLRKHFSIGKITHSCNPKG